jgi:hypothetical protein
MMFTMCRGPSLSACRESLSLQGADPVCSLRLLREFTVHHLQSSGSIDYGNRMANTLLHSVRIALCVLVC